MCLVFFWGNRSQFYHSSLHLLCYPCSASVSESVSLVRRRFSRIRRLLFPSVFVSSQLSPRSAFKQTKEWLPLLLHPQDQIPLSPLPSHPPLSIQPPLPPPSPPTFPCTKRSINLHQRRISQGIYWLRVLNKQEGVTNPVPLSQNRKLLLLLPTK